MGGASLETFSGEAQLKNTLYLIYTKTDKIALQQWYGLDFMMPRTLSLVDIYSSRMQPWRGEGLVRTVNIVVRTVILFQRRWEFY